MHDHVVSGYSQRWAQMVRRWTDRPGSVLGTLGPAGTSSHLAAEFLAAEYQLSVVLFPSFGQIRPALLSGAVDAALVPSAYSGLTRFHWDRELRLLGFFTRPTPDYGIACRTDGFAPDGPLRVAAMWEVRPIYQELMTAELRPREVVWVDAGSTQEGAEILAAGGSDLAVTNDPGVLTNGLRWVASRHGAEIVWTLFGAQPLDSRPLGPQSLDPQPATTEG